MRANTLRSSTLYASENDSSNMDFGDVANYRELVAQSKRNNPTNHPDTETVSRPPF